MTKKIVETDKVSCKKGYLRKISVLFIIALIAIDSSGFSPAYISAENSALRPASVKVAGNIGFISNYLLDARTKSSSAGQGKERIIQARITLLKDAIKNYRNPTELRTLNAVLSFLQWVENEATPDELKVLINIVSKKGFRLISQTEQELRRSSVEVDFRKHADQEEIALLSRIIYKIVDNINLDLEDSVMFEFGVNSIARSKKSSNLFKIALELAKSKRMINSITEPTRIAFVFAIYTGKDRISRQKEATDGEDALRRKIIQLDDLFSENPNVDWQLTAVDDGSPNNSGEFAENILRNEYLDYYLSGKTKVLYLEEAIKGNVDNPLFFGLKSADDSQKGGSIEYGMYDAVRSGADIIIYTDTDISSHLGLAGLLIDPIKKGNVDVTIGSRGMKESLVLNRPFTRKIKSWQDTTAYNNLVITPLLPGIKDIKDTQNAFKAFRANVLNHILPHTIDKKFSFDTELLMLARESDFKLKEIPVPWVDTPDRTTVTMSQGVNMAKNIFSQRRHFKSGEYNLEKSHQYERLILTKGDTAKTFLIIGPLYKSKALILAEDEATGELFVIKKLLTENMEDHAGWIYEYLRKVPEGHPQIYKPEILSAGPNTWAGLENGQAVVCPYVPGQSFKDRFEYLKEMRVLGYFGIELLDAILEISEVLTFLEERKVPGIWDINPGNILIQPDGKPYLIDYTRMKTDPVEALHWLIYDAFRKSDVSNVEDILKNIDFTGSSGLNTFIRQKLTEFNKRVKSHQIQRMADFRDELKELRDYIAKSVLKDLIRDWRNYDKNKDTIRRLTLDILEIESPEAFKLLRPVRVVVGSAGLDTRMDNDKPKVLQKVLDEPIIYHVLKETAFLDNKPIVIVRADQWRDALGKEGTGGNYLSIKESLDAGGFNVEYAFQSYLKGDGYAVLSAKENLKDFDGDLLIVWGDMAVLNPETVRWITMIHQALEDVPLTVATAAKESPYAPIAEDEHRRATGSKKGADSLFGRDDVGLFIGKAKEIFKALEAFPKDVNGDYVNPYDGSINKRGEMSFVQIAAIFAKEDLEVVAPPLADTREAQGVNDFKELKRAETYRRQLQQERSTITPALIHSYKMHKSDRLIREAA